MWAEIKNIVELNSFTNSEWDEICESIDIGLVDNDIYIRNETKYSKMSSDIFYTINGHITDKSGTRNLVNNIKKIIKTYSKAVHVPWILRDPTSPNEFNTFVRNIVPIPHSSSILCTDNILMWFAAIAQNPGIKITTPLYLDKRFKDLFNFMKFAVFGTNNMGRIGEIITQSDRYINNHNLIITGLLPKEDNLILPKLPYLMETKHIIPWLKECIHPELMVQDKNNSPYKKIIKEFIASNDDITYEAYINYCKTFVIGYINKEEYYSLSKECLSSSI